MNTYTTTSLESSQAQVGILGQLLDAFFEIIKPRGIHHPRQSNFSALEDSFNLTKGAPKSLLVVHVENIAENDDDANARLAHQARVLQQLNLVFGTRGKAAAIGVKEYAVLLNGIDQCSELIPRIEEMLSRTSAGNSNNGGEMQNCRVGIARCPIDADELSEAIHMASNAASELNNSDQSYQFISRRHRQR